LPDKIRTHRDCNFEEVDFASEAAAVQDNSGVRKAVILRGSVPTDFFQSQTSFFEHWFQHLPDIIEHKFRALYVGVDAIILIQVYFAGDVR
jgi:hypothetical protein